MQLGLLFVSAFKVGPCRLRASRLTRVTLQVSGYALASKALGKIVWLCMVGFVNGAIEI